MPEAHRIMNNQHSINTHCPCSACPNKQVLQLFTSTHTRGHKYKLQTHLATGARKQFFATRVTADWNNLNESTVTAEKVNTFKSRLEKDWSSKDQFSYTFFY